MGSADLKVFELPGEEFDVVELWPRVVGGDEAAFAKIYQFYSPLIFTLAVRVLENVTCAEDVVQNVFVSAWRDRHTFHPDDGTVARWLACVAYRSMAHAFRDRREPTPEI